MSAAAVRVDSVRAELRTDSDDVATATPRLSWTSVAATDGWEQASAEIRLDDGTTATVVGRNSVLVDWPFAALRPRERRTVSVRVTGVDGGRSAWSEPHEIVAAFLADGEWTAELIGLAEPSSIAQPALLRTEFEVSGRLARATLYATAQGSYQARINGTEVDDQILKPGWTPYRTRMIHESTDVTALLTVGRNAIGIALVGAWYTERYGFRPDSHPHYGEQPSVAAQLLLEYEDGSVEHVVTDAGWRASADGPLRESGIYDGDHVDLRRALRGWAAPGFDDSAWAPVRLGADPAPVPTARTSPAVRAIEELAVREVVTSASGGRILDFGQNLVGRLRLRLNGPAGTVVTLRHAEVLEHGELGTRPLRLATATDTVVLDGEETVWEPEFTFHGFRYAEVTGLPDPIEPAAVTAVVIHSDLRRTGWFDSSDEQLNRLHENVVWGMKGNFLYLPTDCPQRDERLGWTGDIQVFAPTASFLFDADGFLSSWLVDLAQEQTATGTGSVPFVIPNALAEASTPAAAWGDAATVVPMVLHERFGDLRVVAAQYDSMRGWTDHLLGLAGERMLWEGGFQFGDWLDPTAPPEDAAKAMTAPDIVASAYLFRSVTLTAEAATLLGHDADAEHYGDLAARIRTAFLAEYVGEDGSMTSDAQTAYALGIMFDLADTDELRQAMGARLAELVERGGHRIGTGFVGTPIVTDALTVTGHLDTASRLLMQTENPSWLYPVTMGATTIWERWDSMLEDGSINPGEMTSFNHYALGAVADWLHRSVAGLAPAEPGYRVIRIEPRPIPQLDHASARLDTPYGRASVAWHRDGGRLHVEAEVPANSSAEVLLPGETGVRVVGSGRHRWTV